MANFGVHQDPPSSCLMSINKLMYQKTVVSPNPSHNYPASVTEFSAMIAQAKASKSSSPECDSCRSGPVSNPFNNNPGEPAKPTSPSRGVFNNVHTCGSIYAKCQCKYEQSSVDRSFSCSLSTGEDDEFYLQKRSSNPSISTSVYRKLEDKRLSNPEVLVTPSPQVCLKQKSPKSPGSRKTIIKANVYLNHPEINFPIPVELSKEEPKTNNLHPELKSKLDYHRATALAYESHTNNNTSTKDLEAEKFLKDFGILGPSMGNGIASNVRRSSRTSIDNNAINQIRRNSKNLDHTTGSTKLQQEEHLKAIIIKLKKEIQDMEVKYLATQTDLYETRRILNAKENELVRLEIEVHKLKSVLQQTTSLHHDEDILTSIQEKHAMANRLPQNQQPVNSSNIYKKQGVSAESSEAAGQAAITKHDKDFRSKQLIKDAIMDNDFLKHLDTSQVREIVDSMVPKDFPAGTFVLRQGQAGVHLFVSAEGDFEIIQDNKVLGHMGPGKAFGELAILYNCTRTASIKAVTDSKVWMLDRKVFQQIMKRTGLQRLQDNISFLKSVPLLAKLSNDVLAKIADVLEVEFYPSGAYIIRQGASGDTFFIISSGSVKVTQRLPGHLEEEEIRVLQRGDYFGEQALLKEDFRTASVIAMHPGVECLTLDRDSFKQLIGDLSEIKDKDYGDELRLNRPVNIIEQQEYDYIQLDDLDVVATLGIGGFGRVELVQYINDTSLTFALKCLKKQHIVDTQQEDHIYSERNIMMSCRSPFICRLYRTYRDSKYVYMLLEACLGGEVWTILRDRGCFDDHTTRFITACVVEAFDYLHNRGIIYRDLKPENLLLDNQGYVKLVDFGFSKRLGYSSKTWTFCGTPEYVAPETILNKGHDRAVDYWALGILMHELLTGNPPFTASDPMKTYNLILKGIDMIDFAKHNVGRSAQSLIKKLCRDSPSERLGYQRGGVQDIKKHKWFQGFDWDGLICRTLPAPIKQCVRGPRDTSNFDCFGKDNDIPPDENSEWDANF